jgi:hypothetical protein
MKVGGEKMVRTEKEIDLGGPAVASAAQKEEHPANAPTLRRPGEESTAPRPGSGDPSHIPNNTPPQSPHFSSPAR